MKTIKFFVGLVGFLVITVFLLNLLGGNLLASGLSTTLGTDVDVKRLKFDPLKSQVGIYGLQINNVEGYQEPVLASIPEIYVDLDLTKILGQELVIEEIRLNIEKITVERGADKKFNLVNLKPLKDLTSGSKGQGESEPQADPKEKPASDGPKIKTRIDEAVLTVGKVNYVDYSKGPEAEVRDFSLNVNEARLSEIKDVKHLIQEVVLLVMKKVGLRALVPDFEKFSAAFGSKMEDVKTGLGNLMDKVKQSLSEK